MQLCFAVLTLAASVCNAASAQAPAPAAAFETATIRPSQMTPGCFSMLPPGGTQYAITCIPLRGLIAMAWKINPNNIQGGDAHVLDTFYDLRASTAADARWTPETIGPMLQQLLTERFHIVFHSGTKQVSGFGLVVAKGGSKLKPAATDSGQQGWKAGEPSRNFIAPGQIQGRGVDVRTIAALLSAAAHATVVDHTGITGVFNVDLRFAPDNSTDQTLPSFFTAVEEQLGLKLQPEKVSVNTLVLDHVDAAPTPD
jgi:uncharacterized protein (TIGR03435 family)